MSEAEQDALRKEVRLVLSILGGQGAALYRLQDDPGLIRGTLFFGV